MAASLAYVVHTPFRAIRLYRREHARSVDPKSVLAPALARFALAAWLSHPSSRRTLIELAGLSGRRHTEEAASAARAWLEGALDRGRVIAVEVRTPAVTKMLTGAPAALGPAPDVALPDDWIRVLVFEASGAPVAVARGLTLDVNVGGRPVPDGKGIEVVGGSAGVDVIKPGGPTACQLGFYVPDDAVPSTAAHPGPPDPASLRTRQDGPTLDVVRVTRREIATTPQPGYLNATNAFQLQSTEAEVIEFEHFNDGGAIFLPGPAPSAVYRPAVSRPPRGMDVLEACLTLAKDYSLDRIIITGHDAVVSQQRADGVRALLVGDVDARDTWTRLAAASGSQADARAILEWVATDTTFGATWDCNPSAPDGGDFSSALERFKAHYNIDAGAGAFATAPPGEPLLDEDSPLDPPTWAAMFDCYMRALRPISLYPATPAYIVVDDKHQTYPVELAQIAAPGRDANRWTDLNPLNPRMVRPNGGGWYPPQIGQLIYIPSSWSLSALEAAGYACSAARRPMTSGPPPLAAPGPVTHGCAAHHLTTPFVDAEERRARQRHVEVVFFDGGESLPSTVCSAKNPSPCTSRTCALYDPREYVLRWRPVSGLGGDCEGIFRFHFPHVDLANIRLAIQHPDGTLHMYPVDDEGKARVIGRAADTFVLLHIYDGDQIVSDAGFDLRYRISTQEDSL